MVDYAVAKKASTEYFNGDELAAEVFLGKYALRDSSGELLEETPDDMHMRLAKEFARIEAKYPNPLTEDEIYNYLKNFEKIVPQGSPMAGIGNPYQLMSISNCFVVPSPHDSYGGILKTDQEQAQIMKRRGGVGFDISTIRPRGMNTSNAAKTTDGIGVFMERYSNTCREVAQGGRRGALMLTVSVHHPEIETFINIKRDLTKVTGANISIRLTDEFMNAVQNKEDVELRFPVDAPFPEISRKTSAVELWDKIIEAAHASAEPGLLFWDTVERRTPSNCYPEFKALSTNPCLAADTLIAVADGRHAVSIKQLADEGRDVPVYSVNKNTGMVSIKMARNPRITGYDQELVRVTLDDGTHYDTTPNHGFILRDGTKVEAKDLKPGDSLSRFDKRPEPIVTNGEMYYRINTNTRDSRSGRIYEHRLVSKFYNPETWKEKSRYAKQIGFARTGGIVVHHKNFNGLDNHPDNLEVLTFREHQELHARLADVTGENNPRYSGVSVEDLKSHAVILTNSIGQRFSVKQWQEYAAENNLPQSFSSFRIDQIGSIITLAKWAAIECEIDHVDTDPRTIRAFKQMLEMGYNAEIIDGVVVVERTCEACGEDYTVAHDRRESAYCSHLCALKSINASSDVYDKRMANMKNTYTQRSVAVRDDQARIYSELKFNLGRKPQLKEWETACKNENVSYRLRSKNAFQNFKELATAGDEYNHKVVSVEKLAGHHTVYNLTVDDNHTMAIVSPYEKDGIVTYSGINTTQCGEIILGAYDACRLLLTNVVSFVKNPFTDQAIFDSDQFSQSVRVAQRLMDDIVDLELECIDRIIAKVKADPEPEDIKRTEIELWQNIRNTCERGRRTGTGVTAIGDAVAARGYVYGSDESINFIEWIYKLQAVAAYAETIQLAKERGAFPSYDWDLEESNEFLQQMMAELPEDVLAQWKEYGRRNIALTTTAPAGSVSIMTQTTSGIEPAYLLSYKRRKKINPMDIDSRVDFVDDLGDKWQEFTVYHHWFKKWMDVTGKEDPTESPYHGATSNDIDWVNKVKAQAAAQKWVCHSISNTTNMPNDATVDTVKQVYLTGWESGCKGVTIYREGSRAGIFVAEEEKDDTPQIITQNAPKRPVELPCDVHNMTVLGDKWTFFVGLLGGRPYEIMGGLSQYVNIPRRVKVGKIVKHNGASHPVAKYDFHYDYEKGEDDETIVHNITTTFDNATYAAFTRTISLALRHGTPVQFVVEQIQKGAEKEDNLFSFSKAVSRVLKHYIVDGTQIAGKSCKDCGSDQLTYQEGCMTCQACGSSKCG